MEVIFLSKKKAVKKKEGAHVCPTCEKTLKKIEVWVCPGCWTVHEMARKAPGE